MFVERLQVNKIEDDGVHLQCESLIFAVSLSQQLGLYLCTRLTGMGFRDFPHSSRCAECDRRGARAGTLSCHVFRFTSCCWKRKMACGGFFSPAYFLLLFCSLFRLSTLPCNVPHDPRPHRATAQNSHHGNGWTVLSTNLRHAHMSPPEEFITSSLQRGHGPCVHTLKKAMRGYPVLQRNLQGKFALNPPHHFVSPPHHHGFLKLQPFMGLLQVPFDRFSYFQHHGVYHNNSQTVLCSTFSSPSTNFPPRFFSLTSSPSLRSRTWMGDPLLLLSSSFAFDFRHFHLQVF